MITKTFAERQHNKIRGILRAVTRPVSLTQISSSYKIEEQKMKSITEQLMREGFINGKIQLGLFVPTSFLNMQENAVKSFFS